MVILHLICYHLILFSFALNSNVTIDAANGGGGGMWFWNTGANTPTISTSSIVVTIV